MVTIMLVVFYFDNALDLGMGAALVYEQEEGVTDRVQVAFSANVVLGFILAAIAFVTAPVITSYFHLNSSTVDYTMLFRCMAIVIVLSSLSTVPWSLFQRNMQFQRQAVVEVSRDLSRFVVTLGLALAGYGAWSVMIGLFACYGVQWVLTWIVLPFRPTFKWDTTTVKQLFAYAWRVAGNRVLGLLALNGDYFIVGNRKSSQYPLYYQAFRLPEFIMGAQLNGLSAVLFPMYSRIRSKGNDALCDAMYKALRIVALFSIPVGVGLALIARDAFTVFYGTQNDVGIRTMEVISLAGAVTGIGFATGDLLMATNRPGVLLRINAVMVPVMLVAMWFVAPQGIVFVAFVHLFIQIVFVSIRQGIVDHIIGASTVTVLASLVPGIVVALCITAAALPVRLVTGESFASLVEITAAGVGGGLIGAGVYAPARKELLGLVSTLRGR
jgi:lipopolysaccharide exporter